MAAPSRANDSAMANARLHLFATPAMTAVFPSSSFGMNLIEYPDGSAPYTHCDRFAHYLRVPVPVALCAGASYRQPTVDSSSFVDAAARALLAARHHRQRRAVYSPG